MSPVQQPPTTRALCIDALLQDTYLLVVELCRGASVRSGPELWALCARQVETVQAALRHAEEDARSIDLISHAQCALLDETVLRHAQGEAHAAWAEQTLQARFFSRHQAGEFLYEDMRTVLREPAANPHVLTAFHRVLMLGFLGRYRDIADPQRQQLVQALAARVAPLGITNAVITQAEVRRRGDAMPWLPSSLIHVIAALALLAGVWWGLDRALGGAVVALLAGQV
ncbi:type VI secretion system protein TssL, short form [Pseudomonas inefficax]|uniref:type VI secretion system protein TssL, short form n=1 Tax=Pseudomonas inefficax TaxID=2078786 RepID=UPI004046900E